MESTPRFNETNVYAHPPCDVCLVSMPVVALERPSLALGILKAGAQNAGLRVHCLYPAFDFAESIGLETYCRILDTAPDKNLGDWLFAGAAFPEHTARQSAYIDDIDYVRDAPWASFDADTLRRTLTALRLQAEQLVLDTAAVAVASGARIVGCTSVFQQQGASLALLRAVKRLDPGISTMIGGANCEADMGVALHRCFPWIDFVVSGEADLLFPGLCHTILRSSRERIGAVDLPDGVLGPCHRGAGWQAVSPAPRARVDNLDACPIPDFGDYFDALARSPLRPRIYSALPVETSRGCWWGQTHHCTFCGLNGGNMQYRCKSAPRVLGEFNALAERFGTHRLHVVDNIMSRDHLKTVIPALAEKGAPYSLFYETKANLSAEEVELLAAAGVRRIQPGIESLSLGALKLMEKGTTPVTNLQLLRHARCQGIFVTWNFLWQFPGDESAWYAEVAKWLPLVFHLQAPNTLVPVRFDRFSPYHQRPQAYGLSLTPTPGLRHIYPVEDAELADLAYYFEDCARPVERLFKAMDFGSREFARLVQSWMGAWRRIRSARPDAPEPPRLEMSVTDGAVEVIDTRPVRRAGLIRLEGLDAEVLLRCDLASSRARLAEELGGYPESALDEAIERLSSLGLILALDGRLLALPTRPQRRPYIDVSQYPGGYVIRETQAAGVLQPTPA